MNSKALLISIYFVVVSLAAANLPGAGTETMHSVAHVKPGREAEYAKLTAEAWDIYKQFGFVLDSPHVVLRGMDEKGRPYFVECLRGRVTKSRITRRRL